MFKEDAFTSPLPCKARRELVRAGPGAGWDGASGNRTSAGNRPAALSQLAQRTRLSGLQDALHSRYVSH